MLPCQGAVMIKSYPVFSVAVVPKIILQFFLLLKERPDYKNVAF